MHQKIIAENIKFIETKIENACKKAGVKRENITLMAVSKTQSIEKLQIAKDCGLKLFGENRVQEFLSKADFFAQNGTQCHLIGALQNNKVKYLPKLTNFIQSVHSEKLLLEIQKQYEKHSEKANVLLQVNIANEPTKSGINARELPKICERAQKLANVQLRGLMCIPPPLEVCGEKQLRFYFDEMRELFLKTKQQFGENIDVLSMGMSEDFAIAIEHGSTLIRVGSAIFGAR